MMVYMRLLVIILYIGSCIATQRPYVCRHRGDPSCGGRSNPNRGRTFESNSVQYCGQTYLDEFSGRIINGEEADERQFPWMAKLVVKNFFFCGGTLIAKNYVLTAGHCVASHVNGTSDLPRKLRGPVENYSTLTPNKNMKVILGSKQFQDKYPPTTSTVLKIMLHPNYDVFVSHDYMMQTNDIAVLRIKPVKFSQFVSPICLPRQGARVPDHTMLTVAGWGLVQEASEDHKRPALNPTSLMKNSMQKISWSDCRKSPKSGPFLAPENDLTDKRIICMLGNNTDACQGDSGGAVVERTPQGSIMQGIVSWGIGCNQPNFPSAYTRVASYVKFIRSHTKGAHYLPMKPEGDTWKSYATKNANGKKQYTRKPPAWKRKTPKTTKKKIRRRNIFKGEDSYMKQLQALLRLSHLIVT